MSSRDFMEINYSTFHRAPLPGQQKSNFKSKHPEIHEETPIKIKNMMDHVHHILKRMLQSLNYIYQTNGIIFQVDSYLVTLVRLLTPHELLSQFHLVDNFDFFSGNYEDKAKTALCQYQKKWQEVRPIEKNVFPKIRTETKARQEAKQIQRFQINDQNEQWPSKNMNRNRPMLGQGIQRNLSLWVIQQIVDNKDMKIADIRKKAKELAYKVENFKCSSGWTERFFIRHPYLKKMLAQRKAGNQRAVEQMYYRIRQKLLEPSINQNEIIPKLKQEEESKNQECMRISNAELEQAEAEIDSSFNRVESGVWAEAEFNSEDYQQVNNNQSNEG